MRNLSLMIFLLGALIPPPVLAAGEFTLDQILSSPFPSHLTAASSGDRIAWVMDSRGIRNIWVATAPDFIGRQLTGFDQDDGQELSSLSWSPDGTLLAFVKGGDENSRGEIPNPVLHPQGAEQAVWIADLGQTAPRRLAEGSEPVFSPSGKSILYLKGGKVWEIGFEAEAKPEKLFNMRGRFANLTWSPDGTRLAFVNSRGTHSFIGIYTPEGKTLVYLDPSVDRDMSPVWSPDGGRLAFIRLPATTRQSVFGPRRKALVPWSIRTIDVLSGRAQEIWRADPGMGSVFRWVVASRQLFWLDSNQIVFPWEKDGWTHLWAVPVEGGEVKCLTPGAFEVEHVSAGRDRRSLYFSSNQGDINRRHLWKLDQNLRLESVTSGKGIEWEPVEVDDSGTLAYFQSDAVSPAKAVVQRKGGDSRDLAVDAIPADFPQAELIEPQEVHFIASDGLPLQGQLFLPRSGSTGERMPAVVFFHGGSRRQMLLGWHYMYYYHNAYAFNQYLANRGYVVLSVNYRSGIGYGMEFREALDYGAAGGSEFADVQGAGLYLAGRSDVDPARIGLWGGSYGGYLTALGLARASDLFAAGVDLHGVHDWNLEWSRMTDGWNESVEAEVRELAWESSPMAYVDGWKSPVLMIHGDDDRNVDFRQTIQLTEDLRARGVEVEVLIFPDEVHDFLLHLNWLKAYQAAAQFFDRHLGNGESNTR